MRTALSLLLSFVLIQSQAFALSGGPRYGNGGSSLVGSYSGVMIPDGNSTSDPLGYYEAIEAMGLFTISVPEQGLASGVINVFSEGGAYSGTFSGFADSDAGAIKGVLDATNITVVEQDDTTYIGFGDNLSGSLDAQVTDAESFYYIARIAGTATTQVSDWWTSENATDPVKYVVDGVKQSNYASALSAAVAN